MNCFTMKKLVTTAIFAATAVAWAGVAQAQFRDAGSKARGEYSFYTKSAGRSMRNAREYSQTYREYVRTAPAQKVNPEVAKETADSIGQYIAKAQKHMSWMRKQAVGDKVTLASLDVIDKNLADAAKSHAEMHETCLKDNIDAAASMDCCKVIDDSLAKAIAEHDKLMKTLAAKTPATK